MAEEFTLPDDEAPKKLDNFLKKRFPIGYVRKLFRKNGIRLNGRHPKPDEVIRPGDRIRIYLPFEAVSDGVLKPKQKSPELEIIFEDGELIVVNKRAGVAVHEGKRILKRDSVIGILEAKYRGDGITPRLVHRLDKDTSGLLLVAKNEILAHKLESCFETGAVGKEYLCLVAGRLPQNEDMIEFPLPGREGAPVRAVTRFTVVKRLSDTTLARVRIDTGRMHQIRLHFAKLGFPVVLDDQHGDFAFNKRFRKKYRLKRQFLHAATLTLEYRGKKQTWTAPLPDDLTRTLELLAPR